MVGYKWGFTGFHSCLSVALLLGCFRAPQPRVYGTGPAVVFLGDSLSAGAGVQPEEAFHCAAAPQSRPRPALVESDAWCPGARVDRTSLIRLLPTMPLQ
jgi:hypothetical protein